MEHTTDPTDSELARLSRVLLASYEAHLRQGVTAESVRDVLPEAARQSLEQSQKLSRVFAPALEETINRSIASNKERMVEAFFPLMGPAIRKASLEAVRSFLQSIQLVIEQAFSPRSLVWRFEAIRTGVPISTIVMKHTLVYRVERVFLIHRKSAKILRQVSAANAIEMDKTTFAGMLEAIKEFAQDVFTGSEPLELETLELGDLKIILSEGPHAIVAAVVRGLPPSTLNKEISDVAREIFWQYRSELELDTPVMNSFVTCDPLLEKCLLEQKSAAAQIPRWKHILATGSLAILGLAIVALLFRTYWGQHSQNDKVQKLLTELKQVPNVVITSVQKQNHQYQVVALAESPGEVNRRAIELSQKNGLLPNEIKFTVYKTEVVESTVYQTRLSDFLKAGKQLEDLKLMSSSANEVAHFTDQAVPQLIKIHHLGERLGGDYIVFVNTPQGEEELAREILWTLYNRLVKNQVVDYHMLRLRSIPNKKDSLVSFHVVEEEP